MNMNQTIFSSDVDTVSINEGETSEFEFVFDQEEAVVTKIELIISWTEGGLFEECDEITINPKLDALNGPIDDGGQQITLDDCSGTELVALTIIPNQEILEMITENTTGSVTSFNSTEGEITALWNKLSTHLEFPELGMQSLRLAQMVDQIRLMMMMTDRMYRHTGNLLNILERDMNSLRLEVVYLEFKN